MGIRDFIASGSDYKLVDRPCWTKEELERFEKTIDLIFQLPHKPLEVHYLVDSATAGKDKSRLSGRIMPNGDFEADEIVPCTTKTQNEN